MTIRDLARELALSEHPERCHLSAATVSRVRAAAARLGYVPNQLAIKLLRKGGTDTIGILYLLGSTDDRNLPVLNQVMKYLSTRKCDYQVFSCLDIHHQPGAFRETIRYIRGMRLRTLVILGAISEKYPLEPDLYKGLDVYVTDCDVQGREIPDFFQYVGLTNRSAFHQWLVQSVAAQGALPIVTHDGRPGPDSGLEGGIRHCPGGCLSLGRLPGGTRLRPKSGRRLPCRKVPHRHLP